MELTIEQKKLVEEIEEDCGIELAWYFLNETPVDIDDVMEYVEERVHEIEVIYYASAMDYLRENDPSLQESLGIAHDMGCTLENLNSETLATLLKQQNSMESLQEYRDQLEELFFSN